MTLSAIAILLVEDDTGDVELTQEALVESKLKMNLTVVNDEVEALDYLRKQNGYANAARPDVILLTWICREKMAG